MSHITFFKPVQRIELGIKMMEKFVRCYIYIIQEIEQNNARNITASIFKIRKLGSGDAVLRRFLKGEIFRGTKITIYFSDGQCFS